MSWWIIFLLCWGSFFVGFFVCALIVIGKQADEMKTNELDIHGFYQNQLPEEYRGGGEI